MKVVFNCRSDRASEIVQSEVQVRHSIAYLERRRCILLKSTCSKHMECLRFRSFGTDTYIGLFLSSSMRGVHEGVGNSIASSEHLQRTQVFSRILLLCLPFCSRFHSTRVASPLPDVVRDVGAPDYIMSVTFHRYQTSVLTLVLVVCGLCTALMFDLPFYE